MSLILSDKYSDPKIVALHGGFGAVVIMLIRETASLVPLAFKCIWTLHSDIRVPMTLLNKQIDFFQLKIVKLAVVQGFFFFFTVYNSLSMY